MLIKKANHRDSLKNRALNILDNEGTYMFKYA